MNAASPLPKPDAEVFQQNFAGTWEDIATAATWLEATAQAQGLSDQTLFNMQVCLEELFTNIVKHGGSDVQSESARSPTVILTVALHNGAAVLTMEDNATPFDVAAAEAHAIDKPLAEVKLGGLGVQLIKTFASDVSYEQAGLGNRVTLRFNP